MSGHERPLVGLDELTRMLEAHEGPSGPRRRPPRHASNRRWTLAVAAGALAVGAGTGFALASTVAPTADAGSDTEGFGFLPARGWNVMQSGSLDRDGVARAIAANVPIDPRDHLAGEPRHTLRSLPPRGVLLSVTFAARGDPTEDVSFPVHEGHLGLDRAEPIGSVTALEYRLRAGIGGYNVDARVYLGSPGANRLAAAERQLERLVVASNQVTIFARPAIIAARDPWTTLYGSVSSARAGESITIQAKDCGADFFRVVDDATTTDGGGWSTRYSPGISTVLRAIWNDKASNQVAVRQRPWVSLRRLSRGPWQTTVGSTPRGGMPGGPQASFWGRRVTVQRFDRGRGWRPVKRVVLRTDGAEFRLALPKGTLIRAVFPLAEARPCYLDGVSFVLRT